MHLLVLEPYSEFVVPKEEEEALRFKRKRDEADSQGNHDMKR